VNYPELRLRRLRRTPSLRRMARETRLTPDAFVAPLFAIPGKGVRQAIASMPGVERLSVDQLVEEARMLHGLGIPSLLVFGLPESKDAQGSGAWDPQGPVARAVREVKKALPDLVVMADVCMCEYTDHGHCGVLVDGDVDNDATLPLLTRAALAYADAGADVIAPSDMMDGRIGAIRDGLDKHGHGAIPILSYAAKFASGFYGPFREAADSAPQVGDRRGYQMDPANAREAMREIELDLAEGADAIMVKPALAYLDIVRAARERFDVPIAVYNVSGEYSMVKAAARNGWIDEPRVVLETLTSMRRAGADWILTYHAAEATRWLAEGRLP